MKKIIPLIIGLVSVSGVQGAPAAGVPAAKIIVQDDPHGPRGNWSCDGEIANGELVLTAPGPAQYVGAQTLLNQPVPVQQ